MEKIDKDSLVIRMQNPERSTRSSDEKRRKEHSYAGKEVFKMV